MDEIINTKSLREQVANVLRLKIIKGELRPGDRISERDLSASLHISTSPIKEAFRMLETAGLLISAPRKGTVVSEFARQSLLQVSVLRSALEGVSAHLAALYMTDSEIGQLSGLVEQAGNYLANDQVDELEQINNAFHRMITEYARNSYLAQLIDTQIAFIQGFRHEALLSLEARRISNQEHGAILAAIQNRNSELAEECMRNHIRRSSAYALDNFAVSPDET